MTNTVQKLKRKSGEKFFKEAKEYNKDASKGSRGNKAPARALGKSSGCATSSELLRIPGLQSLARYDGTYNDASDAERNAAHYLPSGESTPLGEVRHPPRASENSSANRYASKKRSSLPDSWVKRNSQDSGSAKHR